MTQAEDLTAREAEIIRILRVLSSGGVAHVVIGGYAVNALTSHRFSVDWDVVVAEKDFETIIKILQQEGYSRQASVEVAESIQGAKGIKYAKLIGGRKVSVDMFVDKVICRQTRGHGTIT